MVPPPQSCGLASEDKRRWAALLTLGPTLGRASARPMLESGQSQAVWWGVSEDSQGISHTSIEVLACLLHRPSYQPSEKYAIIASH